MTAVAVAILARAYRHQSGDASSKRCGQHLRVAARITLDRTNPPAALQWSQNDPLLLVPTPARRDVRADWLGRSRSRRPAAYRADSRTAGLESQRSPGERDVRQAAGD